MRSSRADDAWTVVTRSIVFFENQQQFCLLWMTDKDETFGRFGMDDDPRSMRGPIETYGR